MVSMEAPLNNLSFLSALTAGVLLLVPGMTAQTRPYVRATGTATVALRPDLARLAAGVVTQATTAQEAAAQNATQVTAVLNAMRQLLGPAAEIRTISYSLNPNYRSQPGGQPVLVGYTASNTVEAATDDLAIIGRLIDTCIQAGATNVGSLRFGLKDDQPARGQALRQAAVQARVQADAIVSGLGLKTGAVLVAAEGVAVRVSSLDERALAAPATPVETGLVQVTGTVTLELEITP